MTGTLRSTARNPIGIALMGGLILVFLVLGVGGGGGRFPDAFRGSRADAVVIAGSHSIGTRDFKRIFDQQKEDVQKQNPGQTLTTELLVEKGFDEALLDALSLDKSLVEMLARAGIAPGPAVVDAEIRKLPFAFDHVTGKFSEQQFTQALAQQGMTPREAQVEITDELAQRHFSYAVEAGFRVPRIYAALSAVTALENRDVSYFILDPRTVAKPAPPTDVQLMAFMKEHAAQLTLPEMRVIDLVRFSAKDQQSKVTIDPGATAKEFAFRKDALSSPETRTIVQIPVKTTAQAATVSAGLAKGGDPTAVAKAIGAEAIVYADKPQMAIADRRLAAAAFGLKLGQTSGAVQGDLGMAVLKAAKITPGVQATLETARAKIETDLRDKAARDLAYELSQKFDDARQGGANLADSARKAGVPPIAIGPVTADGRGLDGKVNPLLTGKILKTAFARAAGEETDIQDAEPGEYYALRVEKVIPPALPSLAEKRPELVKVYLGQQFLQALRAKADGLMDQVRKGASLESVAAGVGSKVAHQTGMQRIKARQYQALGKDFLEGAFASKPGAVFAVGAPGGVFIVKLDAVRPGDVLTTARVLESIRGQASQAYVRDLLGSAKMAARAEIKPTVSLKLARQVLGIDPALLAKSAAKPAPAAK